VEVAVTPRTRIILVSAVAAIVIAASVYARGYYNFRYGWPRKVQNEVLGFEIADPSRLVSKEGRASYGQGLHRWRYRVDPGNERVRQLCGPQRMDTCRITRSRTIEKGVDLTVGVDAGIITVSEEWS
jgi:hypothetical protein